MFGYFILSLMFFLLIFTGFYFSNVSIFEIINILKNKELIDNKPEVINTWLIKNNKLILDNNSNEIFFITWQDEIKINTDNPSYNDIMIKFVNYKDLWKKHLTYNFNIDYKLVKCKDSTCKLSEPGDFVIYKFINNSDKDKKINELLVQANNRQYWIVSFLKYDKNWTIDYRTTFKYLMKTGDNLLKFPTIIVKPGEKLYIKLKVIDNYY